MAEVTMDDCSGKIMQRSIIQSVQYDIFFGTGLVYYVFSFPDLEHIPTSISEFRRLNNVAIEVAVLRGKMHEFVKHHFLPIILLATKREHKQYIFQQAVEAVNGGKLWERNHRQGCFDADILAQCLGCGNIAEANFTAARAIRGIPAICIADINTCGYCYANRRVFN